jgi:CheY-like chemotaxis protein
VADGGSALRVALSGLELSGLEATAANGDAAVAQVCARPPDVILCDLRLRDGELGVDVVDRLKRECDVAVPCAFVTAEASPEHLAKARATGHPIAFKPTTPGKLRALLEHLASHRTSITE